APRALGGLAEAAPRCRPVLPRGRLARRRLFPRGGARRTGSCRGRARGGARRRRWSSTSRAAWTPRRAGRCSRCGTSCARRCTLSARWWQGAPRLRVRRASVAVLTRICMRPAACPCSGLSGLHVFRPRSQ
ncbi:unnamed protein product, partial [Prorocentrum cordatum]